MLFSYKVLDCILSEFHEVEQRHCYYRMEAILVPKEQPYYPQPAAGHTLSFFHSYAEKVVGALLLPIFICDNLVSLNVYPLLCGVLEGCNVLERSITVHS